MSDNGTKSNDEYLPYIKVTELATPIGDTATHAAKVEFMVRNPGPNSERIYPTMNDEWGKEYWGKNANEAEAKAQKEADAWIDKHGRRSR